MKKVIFVITILFLMSAPFYSYAVPVNSQKKSIHQPVNFSKKQKKKNFFQRIILKKIQRKIDRQSRMKGNQIKYSPSDQLAKKSISFGIISLLSILVGLLLLSTIARISGLIILIGICLLYTSPSPRDRG